jgi:ribosomal protein S18 acetylase RimI-like enzyme
MPNLKFSIVIPKTQEQFEKYYHLRWLILRQPWDQPLGSEKDEYEKNSFHIMAVLDDKVIGVGRLHSTGDDVFHIRYMAVDEKYKKNGIGSAIIDALEKQAALLGAKKIVLNARENAIGFYQKKGYSIAGPAHSLFGVIKHFKMEKNLNL